jgi:L-malate glycosyltransferase
MKILHITESYYPDPGGVSGIMRLLSEGLVKQGHEVTVATKYNPKRKTKVINNVEVQGFNVSGKFHCGYEGEVERYQEFVRGFDCDILTIYAAQTWAADLVFPLLGQIGAKKIFIPCGFSSLYDPKYREYFAKMPDVLRIFDHIMYFDKYSWDYAFGQRHSIQHFSVIPLCADFGGFEPKGKTFREEYKIKTEYYMLCVATYGRNKAQHYLLEAFLKTKSKDVTLVCIGNKPSDQSQRMYYYMLHLMGLAAKINNRTRSIKLLKDVRKEMVVNAFHEADLFLLGSTFEAGTPLVIYEAMAAGLPFISSKCGSLSELYYPGGWVVNSTREMANGIDILLSDEKLRYEIANQGQIEYNNNYTISHYIENMTHLYTSVLK